MIFEYALRTDKVHFYNITPQVREAVAKSGVMDGLAVIHCPHTTAGITVNENTDPDVVCDLLIGLEKAFPDRSEFRHSEDTVCTGKKAGRERSERLFAQRKVLSRASESIGDGLQRYGHYRWG